MLRGKVGRFVSSERQPQVRVDHGAVGVRAGAENLAEDGVVRERVAENVL